MLLLCHSKYDCHVFVFCGFPKVVVDSVLAIKQQEKPIDLHMVEIMEMMHKSGTDTS